MLDTLRQRLIVSHVLPLLLAISAVGFALIYVLETQVLLVDLVHELSGNAALVSELARADPAIWTDPAEAAAFANRMSQVVTARVMLVDMHRTLVASSDSNDADRLGKPLDVDLIGDVLDGEKHVRTSYSQHLHGEIADVWMPVVGPDQRTIGAVRLSHGASSVQALFLRLRWLILSAVSAGLLLGTAVGLMLALNIDRPLRLTTQTISRLATERHLAPLPVQGPREIRTLLRSVNGLVDRLGNMEQERRHLLANLVHELGRPLGALQAAVQVLRGGAEEDPALREELLAGTQEEISRLRRLLDDLAGLHDQVVGVTKLEHRPLVLSDWLATVLPPWREAALRKELHWEMAVPDNLPVVQVDPDRLGQALGNLLSNAIKYTPARGTISVTADADDDAARIRVTDNGPGIPADEQAHIFTPFFRGRSSGRFPRGMGLGLSIARDLVVAHGGKIEVVSRPNQGTSFTISVPLTRDHEDEPAHLTDGGQRR